jgi:glycosyltransferase involved in cell wall biosynthesis
MNGKRIVSVSIIVPNYNNGRFLHDFIQSVLNSSTYPTELIIVDDGSTDDSIQRIREFGKLDFLTLICFKENRGLTAALNAGLDVASCKYIMRADPDDILLPQRIETQFEHMEKNPEIDVLGSNVSYFKSTNGAVLNISNFPTNHAQIESTYRSGEHGLQHPTAFVRGDIFRKYKYQRISPGEDYELFARMIKDGLKFANLTSPLYLMRVHPNSSTSNLKLESIRQTFKFRDEIFGTKTKSLWVHIYFLHISHYRSYQLAENGILKYLHLAISAIMYPRKIWKRL